MKTKWHSEIFQRLEELSVDERNAVVGGETLWYWVAYPLFLAEYMLAHPNSHQSSGQQLMNVALG